MTENQKSIKATIEAIENAGATAAAMEIADVAIFLRNAQQPVRLHKGLMGLFTGNLK